jgi:hypothetical protein
MYEAEAELEQLLRHVDRQVALEGEAMLGPPEISRIIQAISDAWTYNRPLLQAMVRRARRSLSGALGDDSVPPTRRSRSDPPPPSSPRRRYTPPPPPSSPPPSQGPTGTVRSPGAQPPPRRSGQREAEAELSRVLRQVDRVAAEAEFEAGLRF